LPVLFSAPRRLQSLDQGEEDEEEDDCAFPADAAQLRSPALVRGTAVGPSHREWNRRFVHGVKAAVFDALYPPSTAAAAPGEDGGGSSDAYYASFYARFYALETVARMPYFAYVSVLHLLETLGRWRRAEFLKLHFSEAWNELHHLLILEELLGNRVRWRDQFVAQHLAVFYYWAAVAIYLVNPALAYNVNQAVEEEASETYDSFLQGHRAYLQSRPAPGVARRYYSGDDLYLFDAMHHPSALRLQQPAPVGDAVDDGLRLRRPRCETLYDTFVNIRDDELEHVKTMAYLQGECQVEDDDQSQKQIRREADGAAAAAAAAVPVPVPFLKGGNHTAAAAAPPGALN
jgi:ubiquinol oxidase